ANWKPPGYFRFRWMAQFFVRSWTGMPGPMYVWKASKPKVMTVRSGERVLVTVLAGQPLPDQEAETIWISEGLGVSAALLRAGAAAARAGRRSGRSFIILLFGWVSGGGFVWRSECWVAR